MNKVENTTARVTELVNGHRVGAFEFMANKMARQFTGSIESGDHSVRVNAKAKSWGESTSALPSTAAQAEYMAQTLSADWA